MKIEYIAECNGGKIKVDGLYLSEMSLKYKKKVLDKLLEKTMADKEDGVSIFDGIISDLIKFYGEITDTSYCGLCKNHDYSYEITI